MQKEILHNTAKKIEYLEKTYLCKIKVKILWDFQKKLKNKIKISFIIKIIISYLVL
jgi:hypothetical protein